MDHTVPWAIANASYKRQRHNQAVTEILKIPNRGHSLTIDSGWREVAQVALDFVKRFVYAAPAAAPALGDGRRAAVGGRGQRRIPFAHLAGVAERRVSELDRERVWIGSLAGLRPVEHEQAELASQRATSRPTSPSANPSGAGWA